MSLFTPVQGIIGGSLIGTCCCFCTQRDKNLIWFSILPHRGIRIKKLAASAAQLLDLFNCKTQQEDPPVSCWCSMEISWVPVAFCRMLFVIPFKQCKIPKITGGTSTWPVLSCPSMCLSIIWLPRNSWRTIDQWTAMFPFPLLWRICSVASWSDWVPKLAMVARQVRTSMDSSCC